MVLVQLDDYTQKSKVVYQCHSICKIWFKMDHRLNVRVKAIKLLEGNTEMNLNYPESGNSFLDMTPKA